MIKSRYQGVSAKTSKREKKKWISFPVFSETPALFPQNYGCICLLLEEKGDRLRGMRCSFRRKRPRSDQNFSRSLRALHLIRHFVTPSPQGEGLKLRTSFTDPCSSKILDISVGAGSPVAVPTICLRRLCSSASADRCHSLKSLLPLRGAPIAPLDGPF